MAKSKTYANKYWETEKCETVEFGKSFFRSYDESGKLQIGEVVTKNDGEKLFFVKFVIDRSELFGSEEAVEFLQGTLEMWRDMHDSQD